MTLADDSERLVALTDLDHTLLVEAGAGTGKTSLIAGRVVMLLAHGIAPKTIAAITFTELAASELSLRIRQYVDALLGGSVPAVLRVAISDKLSPECRANLEKAAASLDEITACTIHSFCQQIIMAYAIETGLDPGARIMDGPSADAMFENVISQWLSDRLSGQGKAEDPITVMSKADPRGVIRDIFALARLKLEHPGAGTAPVDLSQRKDIEFVQAVRAFGRWHSAYPRETKTASLISELEALAEFYEDCFAATPTFARLWQLANPPRTASMVRNELSFKQPKNLTSWKAAYGKEDGVLLNAEAERHLRDAERCFADLLGQIGDAMVGDVSRALDAVVERYAQRKSDAAALDFDDLLLRARELLSNFEPVRAAVGEHYKHILVDEFQDTDPIQAGIIFSIAAKSRPARWQDADIREGSLFLVGDPKQAIYAFRGADIDAYSEARQAIAKLGGKRVVHIGANFRSHDSVVEYVNECFAPVLSASGQPGFVPLTSTRTKALHPLPPVAKVTIQTADSSSSGQRDEEAAIVARLCSKLVGCIQIEDVHGHPRRLVPGDVALLAPTGTDLWRYERALEAEGLSVASQAGKTLFLQQETQDVIALLRALSDPRDTLALGAFLRGPMVGLTDEQLLDIADALANAPDGPLHFGIDAPLDLISHPVARDIFARLLALRKRIHVTTPSILLAEAIEQLQLRAVLSARSRSNRGARSLANLDVLIEMARAFDVRGLKAFVRHLHSDWTRKTQRSEGRIDASRGAVEIVTIHSAKGLEWPVVIPINMATLTRPSEKYVYKQSDNTLHWVIGGVASPSLQLARNEQAQRQLLEDQRKWYVACTRARDLLIVPSLPGAKSTSWSRLLNLRFDLLPELEFNSLGPATPLDELEEYSGQSAATFAAESSRVSESSPKLQWKTPSRVDEDRPTVLNALAFAEPLDAFDYSEPVGSGRVRGLVLHKLMEELLTGELSESGDVEARALKLLEQLAFLGDDDERPLPSELASTAIRTRRLSYVSERWDSLVPEISVWGLTDPAHPVAGRIDAAVVAGGRTLEVLDWKSDREPSIHKEAHLRQLSDYLQIGGIDKGAVVYMTTGEIIVATRQEAEDEQVPDSI